MPDPDAPAVIVIHVALLVAVHVQPVAVVTLVLPVVAVDATLAVSGETVKLHGAAWVTVTVCPATVSVPVRAVVPVLAATE